MRSRLLKGFAWVAAVLMPVLAHAQTCSPKAVFSYVKDGETVEEELTEYSGQAPVTGHFEAAPENYDGYEANCEWRIYSSDKTWETYDVLTRSGETLDYTFVQSGTFYVELRVTFNALTGNDAVTYPDEGDEAVRFTVTVAESKLEMPNAFSPNGDGKNDIYRAKQSTLQSIVEFKATIFNRWGQRLYQWTDPHGGWDGTVNGKTVKDGVYFVNVVAKGADGVEYKIRKDVNVLTRFTKEEGTTDE